MIVVTGATGNVGRPLVRMLAEAGEKVTAVSRTLPAELPEGVQAVSADVTEVGSLPFHGAEQLFLLFAPGSFAADVPAILTAAKDSGVRRVVLLSSQGVGTRPESASHGQFGKAVETAVQNSGLEWTILRPSGFQSNTFAWADSVREQRVVAAPFGDVAIPFVDPDDIAAMAAAALLEDGHAGRTYVLTGPEPESPRERTRDLGELLGETVRFVEQTPEEARAQMLAFMPPEVADTTLAILGAPTDEELQISPDVERVLGRAPLPYAAWAARNLPAFR
ncbi:NAD(P)H-binding protein [Nocardia sp. XZ_19_385]|uniref:NAD(P)H-binding protein n=1 Tax=Nocardia sp. XZ_19_385 TaxID=2769488 RepID=UPI00188F774E|nr:NAD(P)H-binding protein [Nocardia sp. XZ_19_385]